MSVKIVNAVLDIYKFDGQESLVIRGCIDPESLNLIKVDSYQREVISGAHQKTLKQALKTSKIPDIELGMRGAKYRVQSGEKGGGSIYYLQDDIYVIDGLQRISAAKAWMKEDSSASPRIGAVIHLETTKEWENERFKILNKDRIGLNGNVLLRNSRTISPAVDMIYRLTEDETFVLFNRVQWQQRMSRTELTTAMTLSKTIGLLHSRFAPGGRSTGDDVVIGLDRMMNVVGRTTMRDNIKTFFEVLDGCFGVKRIVYGHLAVVTKSGFLASLADIFTRHNNFWKGNRLYVENSLCSKISKFAIDDPEVVRLAAAGGKARHILYNLMLEHINSGKRSKRLELSDGFKQNEEPPKKLVEEVVEK